MTTSAHGRCNSRMQPGALSYLADTYEPRAPGLAIVLREWEPLLDHDPLSVALEALEVLAGARRLAFVVPKDRVHRVLIDVLEAVFLRAAREVFARDARRPR